MQQNPMSRLAGQCAAVLLALISLSGCAEFLAGRERRAQGWREARVVQIEAGALIGRISEIERSAEWDCRKGSHLTQRRTAATLSISSEA